MKQCKNIINSYNTEQNLKEIEILRLREELNHLQNSFEEKINYQKDCLEKSKEQTNEYESNSNFIFSKVKERIEDYSKMSEEFNNTIQSERLSKLGNLRKEYEGLVKEFDWEKIGGDIWNNENLWSEL